MNQLSGIKTKGPVMALRRILEFQRTKFLSKTTTKLRKNFLVERDWEWTTQSWYKYQYESPGNISICNQCVQLSRHLLAYSQNILIGGSNYFESKICQTINAHSSNSANVSNIPTYSSNIQFKGGIGAAVKVIFRKKLATGKDSCNNSNAETMW